VKRTCRILVSRRSPLRSRLSARLSSPLVYAGVIPFLLLNVFLAAYQGIWFPIDGIPKGRADHLLDRGRLLCGKVAKLLGLRDIVTPPPQQ